MYLKGEGGQDRSSRPEGFYKKGVVGNFEKFTGKQLYQSILFQKTFCYRTPPVAASDKIRFYEKFLAQEGDVKFRKFCNLLTPLQLTYREQRKRSTKSFTPP